MATHTAIVRPDGTILVPVDEAQPGETVVVRIEQPAGATSFSDATKDGAALTVRTADTPEKRERLIQQTLEMGRRLRAQLTDEQIESLNGDWLYDENGLPK